MADGIIKRFVSVIFDRASARKVEGELQSSLEGAGKKAGTGFLRELKAVFDRRMADLKVALSKGLISPAEFKKQGNLAAKQFNVGVIKGMEDARKAGNLTDKEFLKLSRSLKKVGDDGAHAGGRVGGAFLKAGASLAAFFTVDKAIRFFRESITEAIEAEKSASRLDSVLRPLGITYAQVSDEVERFFDTIQKTTRFSDEDARDALTNLITATGDYQLSLKLLDVTAKIAEKRNTTMAEAAQTAADASKGLTRGMKDLGISAGETGDLVRKINTNLGNLATDALETTSGKLDNLNNLWDEFKEQIGAAILGSDNLKDSVGPNGLRGALIDLNTWAKDHSQDITGFVDKIVEGGRALAKISAFILKFQPALALLRLATKDQADAVAAAAKDMQGTANFLRFKGSPGGRTTAPTKEDIEEEARRKREADQKREQRAKQLAAELERINRDIAVRTLQLEQGITEANAREQVRREEILRGHVARTVATIEEGFRKLDALEARLDASKVIGAVSLGVKQTETQAPGALPFEDRGLPLPDQQAPVDQFFDPWFEAMHLLREEVEGAGTLFAELGQAWAEGGLAGFAKMAMHKVKENVARAIEEAAKAFGSFALGNPGAAAAHAKAAAGHTAAAAAWRVVGGAAGGGGGGGGGGASGGVNENRAPNLRGGNVQPVGTEVHLYLSDRIGALVDDVEFQRASLAAMEKARERWGDQARIYVHRGSK